MTESQMQSASTTHDAKPGSVFAGVQPAQRVESTMRMYFLDAALRLKLRSLLWAGLPVTLDAWRQSHDMDAVVASGIWPFISYVDLEVYDVQLAGGRMAELRSAIRAGRTAQDGRSDAIVLATEVSIYAQLGGGKASDFMQTAADGRELAGRMRVITNLVRPMAAPGARRAHLAAPAHRRRRRSVRAGAVILGAAATPGGRRAARAARDARHLGAAPHRCQPDRVHR